MPVLKMLKDKSLIITKLGKTYQDENNAEIIKIILPKELNGNDLEDCHIYLSFINQKKVGNVCDLSEYVEDYSNESYVIEVPLYQMFTYEPGIIEMWIKVIHTSSEMIAKTNSVTYMINPHKEIEGTIPEQEMSIIDNLVIKLDSTEIKVDEISGEVEEIGEYVGKLQQGDVLLVKSSEVEE